jgi:two-component system response regulator DesR
MAVVASSSTVVETLTVGACAPAEFPEAEIRTVLAHAGHTLAFWHEDPADAIKACREKSVELLLLVARRPDTRSLKSVGELAEACETTKVILICEQSGDGNVRKALDAGVKGLVVLSEVDAALPAVIEVVRAGQTSVPSSRSKELQKQILTAREKQILGLVVMGMTNAEIAAKLFLAESTVKSHLSSAFAKLGVASRSEAAAVILDSKSGLGLGILTIPSN